MAPGPPHRQLADTIRSFIAQPHITLHTPIIQDDQPPDPNQKRGTLMIPLLEQDATFREGALGYTLFTNLLTRLAPFLISASEEVRNADARDHARAVEICTRTRQQPNAIPLRLISTLSEAPSIDCFTCVKLSVNMALRPSLLRPHGSECGALIPMVAVGDFQLGQFYVASTTPQGTDQSIHFNADQGKTFMGTDNATIGSMPFEGAERFQLEFFMPKITVASLEGDQETVRIHSDTGAVV